MRELFYANLSKNTLALKADSTSAFSFPGLTQNETLVLGWRPVVNRDDTPVATTRTVQAMRFVIGRRDERPVRGKTRIQIGNPATTPAEGTNLTTPLSWPISEGDLQDALNALSAKPGTAKVVSEEGSLVVRFEGVSAATTFTARNNRLFPTSVMEVAGELEDGEWVTELRFVQAPVAFASTFDTLLPPPPSIVEVLSGGTSGDVKWDEVQKLTIDPRFEGGFYLQRGVKRTLAPFSLADMAKADVVKERLAPLLDTGGEFIVTSVADNAVTIRFSGDMSGTNFDLLEVVDIDAPEPDPTLTLRLNSTNLMRILRDAKDGVTRAQIKLPWEWEVDLENESDDALTDTHKFRGEVTITAALNLEQYSTPANIDFLRPPSPVNYKTRGTGQIANGVLHWSGPIGDGVATVFNVDHDLSSDLVMPFVRQNHANGDVLIPGVDYTAREGATNDTLVITLLGDYATDPPEEDELLVCAFALGAASQYASHTHSIDEVDELREELDAILATLATLTLAAGVGSIGTSDAPAGTTVMEMTLPTFVEAYPARKAIETQAADIASIAASDLPSDADLLGAVHDAVLTSLPGTFPTADTSNKGSVWQNRSAADVIVPAGGGRRSNTLHPGDCVASDGRRMFKVTNPSVDLARVFTVDATANTILLPLHGYENGQKFRVFSTTTLPAGTGFTADTDLFIVNKTANDFQVSATLGGSAIDLTTTGTGTHYLHTAPLKTSWYPADFERLLCQEFVPSDALLINRLAELKIGIAFGLRNKKTPTTRMSDKITTARWRLLIEIGTPSSESAPATTDDNLRGIVWGSTPLLDQTLYVNHNSSQRGVFGARIKRTGASTWTAQKCLYGKWTAAEGVTVAVSSFFLRARLVQFDTTDIPDAEGLVILMGLDQAIAADANTGKLVIK